MIPRRIGLRQFIMFPGINSSEYTVLVSALRSCELGKWQIADYKGLPGRIILCRRQYISHSSGRGVFFCSPKNSLQIAVVYDADQESHFLQLPNMRNSCTEWACYHVKALCSGDSLQGRKQRQYSSLSFKLSFAWPPRLAPSVLAQVADPDSAATNCLLVSSRSADWSR